LIEKKVASKRLGIENEYKTFLVVAEHLENFRKGNDLLIDALSSIKEGINLITVGKGEINLPDNVLHFKQGSIHNEQKLNDVFAAADLFILPSREDNLPNVMLESFASGTPVLSFKTGGMLDWIKPHVTGFFAEEFKAASLAKAIRDFCNNHYQFDPGTIRKYALEHFSVVKQANSYLNLYRMILNRKTSN
jgi:glycosyltransferase involved in cell wall biosynthesis